MEKGLEALESRWQSIDWLKDNYKDTDIPLLKMGDEDFEALEGDTLAVQGMLANRYVAQFQTTVEGWKDALNAIADAFLVGLGAAGGGWVRLCLVVPSKRNAPSLHTPPRLAPPPALHGKPASLVLPRTSLYLV